MSILDNPEYMKILERAGLAYKTKANSFVMGLNMEPCTIVPDGAKCSCFKHHVLVPDQEAIVKFKGELWSYICALGAVTEECSHIIMELIVENEHLINSVTTVKDCLTDISDVINASLQHSQECNCTNPAALIRGNDRCTCAYSVIQDSMKEIKTHIKELTLGEVVEHG